MHEKKKEVKPSGKKTPTQNITKKVEKRQLLGSRALHLKKILQKSKLLFNESLGEDIDSLLGTGIVLKIGDTIMNQFSNELHVDLDIFGPLPLRCISAKV